MKAPSAMDWLLALDIGNSNVVAAASIDGTATSVIPLGHGSDANAAPWMPAAVFLTSDTVYTGQQAINHAPELPSAFAHSPKGFVGADNDRAVELLASIIEEVRRSAVMYLGGKTMVELSDFPGRLVLTHPAAWPSAARQVLVDAATSAGFERDKIELLSEPIAAAYSVPQRHRAGRVVVLDIGGGTCDVAVVDIDANPPRVLTDGGENAVGGNNFDFAMLELMQSRVLEDFGELPEEITSADGQVGFQAQAKRVREELSEAPDATFTVDGEDFLITRAEFESAIAGDIELVRALIADKTRLLSESPGLLSALLVGGSTHTPAIARVVQDSMEVLPHDEPITAVAQGAAEYGNLQLSEAEAATRAAELATPSTKKSRTQPCTPRPGTPSRTTLTRVAALILLAGIIVFFARPNSQDAPAPAPSDTPHNAISASRHTYPNVPLGNIKATTIPPDAPAFKDDYFSCEPMVEAIHNELGKIDSLPKNGPENSGFAGTSTCVFKEEDLPVGSGLTIKTTTPAGFQAQTTGSKPATDPRLKNWYVKAKEDNAILDGQPVRIFTYVRDFGWLIVESASEELIDNQALEDAAAALNTALQLRHT